MTRNEYKLFTNDELVYARKDAVKTVNLGTVANDLHETSEFRRRRLKKYREAKRLLRKMVREFEIRELPIDGEPEAFTGKPETPFVVMEWAVERHGKWTQHASRGDCIVYIRKQKDWWEFDTYNSAIGWLFNRVRIHRWDSETTEWVAVDDFAKNTRAHRVN